MIAGQAIPEFDFFIQWHLTERCNLECRHCYQAPRPRGKGDLRPAEVRRELDGADAMFRSWQQDYKAKINPSIHFTGGEPLLYKGLWEAAGHARELGFVVALLTNGTLLPGRMPGKRAASGFPMSRSVSKARALFTTMCAAAAPLTGPVAASPCSPRSSAG